MHINTDNKEDSRVRISLLFKQLAVAPIVPYMQTWDIEPLENVKGGECLANLQLTFMLEC